MTPPAPDDLAALGADAQDVLAAVALGAVPRTRTWVQEWLGYANLRDARGQRYSQDQIRAQISQLRDAGWLQEDSRRMGFWRVSPVHQSHVLKSALGRIPPQALRDALLHADAMYAQGGGHERGSFGVGRLPSAEAAIARVRLEALLGTPLRTLTDWQPRLPWNCEWTDVLQTAVFDVVDDVLYPCLHRSLQERALVQALAALLSGWHNASELDAPALAAQWLASDTGPDSFALRGMLAEHLIASAEPDALASQLPALLAPLLAIEQDGLSLPRAMAQALLAALPVRAGRWAEAEAAYDDALAALRKCTGKKRGLLSMLAATPYVLALMAQATPASLAKALKFCLAEGGKREPSPDSPWGLMALAVQMRLGAAPRDLGRFKPYGHGGHVSPLDWWRWLMRAWLKEGIAPEPLPASEADSAQRLQERLRLAGLHALAEQLQAALRVLGGERAPAGFFISAPQEGWRLKLDALRAVAEPGPVAAPAPARKGPAETRLLWHIEVDEQGALLAITPLEQSRGPRGWGKPREVTLVKLQRGAEALAPHDAAVARCIRQDGSARRVRMDVAAAAAALLGHPHLSLGSDVDVDVSVDAGQPMVELREASPELDVQRDGQLLRVRMHPGLHPAPQRYVTSVLEQRELEALRALTVLRDSPQRARLVRLTPAQQRVAQLLGPEGLEIPQQGAAQLQEVLRGLGSHFQIHADDAQAAQPAREVPADARLRAELTPVGDGLQLRLVVAPFGTDHAKEGPRFIPGGGRAHVTASLGGETLGVQRKLDLEREHLGRVLDACPMLLEPAPGAPCEWTLDEPEQVLALLERLNVMTAVAALDWPQGKSVRVDSAGLSAMHLQVKSNQDWLAVQGELAVDEQLVLSLKQLIAFAGNSKSRFMPLGEGRYLALTQDLRARLDDLAAVAEAPRSASLDELRLPSVAAPWLQDAAQGMQVTQDQATTDRVYRLAKARDFTPALPATLQATLRPYQEEGYVWAMRLAEAGLGACLADDMGLGKTLQALALLLARAKGGPALVVAPTSLIGNWQAEARRFAPSLKVHVYSESDRDQVIAQMGDHSLLLVSYQLLQQHAEAFAAQPWHTLVLDEAQAIKNAAAKRSQAVFELQADFRLALSGTPIENRLAELWSIMRAVNPGLLGSQARFNERFAGLIERQKDRQAQRTLRRLINPFILRRTKAQVLDDLPPRTELVLAVEPEPRERAHYEALRLDALEAAQKAMTGNAPGQAHLNMLAQLTRLRRAACDPRLVSPGLGWAGAKVQAFGELAAELVANGHKTLVFSQFVDFLTLLREPLDAAGIPYQYLDGSTPAAERTRRVNAFQDGEGELFLISLKAGGFGLNLTVADYVVIADPWWNPAAEDQAAGRAHRIGQQRPVTVYRLVNQGTLEARILELHKDKRELAESVLSGEEGLAGGAVPAPEELLRLMRGS